MLDDCAEIPVFGGVSLGVIDIAESRVLAGSRYPVGGAPVLENGRWQRMPRSWGLLYVNTFY